MERIPISRKLKLAAAMLAVIAVFTVTPTLAWLSASTDPVVNYFSGGAIALTLNEAKVDTNGQALTGDEAGRTSEDQNYRYTAGAVLDKDPTVTVWADSVACYVYVCVDNELPDTWFTLNTNTAYWELVGTSGTMTIYRYVSIVEESGSDQVLTPIFTTVTVSDTISSDDITSLGTKTLTVTAFAIQSDGLEPADADGLAAAYFFDGVDVNSLDDGTSEEDTGTDAAAGSEVTSTSEEPAANSVSGDSTGQAVENSTSDSSSDTAGESGDSTSGGTADETDASTGTTSGSDGTGGTADETNASTGTTGETTVTGTGSATEATE